MTKEEFLTMLDDPDVKEKIASTRKAQRQVGDPKIRFGIDRWLILEEVLRDRNRPDQS